MINVKFEVIDLESQIKTLKSFINISNDYAKFIAENLGLEASSITENFLSHGSGSIIQKLPDIYNEYFLNNS